LPKTYKEVTNKTQRKTIEKVAVSDARIRLRKTKGIRKKAVATKPVPSSS